jgi:hypothetical protein
VAQGVRRRPPAEEALGLVGLGLFGDFPLMQALVAHIRNGADLAFQQHDAGIAVARRTLWAMGSKGERGRHVTIHVASRR